MNWDAIGAIGEIIGALAVVATLLYLASQTRQTRTAVESKANLGTVEAHGRFRQALVYNPDLADLIAKANGDPNISDGEKIRLRAFFDEVFMACVVGILTRTNKRTPRTDVEFLVEFLTDNPYGIIEWKRKRTELYQVALEFCRDVDSQLGIDGDA